VRCDRVTPGIDGRLQELCRRWVSGGITVGQVPVGRFPGGAAAVASLGEEGISVRESEQGWTQCDKPLPKPFSSPSRG
jgi:hypothetical protein